MIRIYKNSRLQKKKLLLSLVTFALVAVLLLINIGLDALVVEKNLYIDMTDEKLYTLSDGLKAEIADVRREITITFCNDKDYLLSNYETRYVYIMAKEIEKYLDNVEVVTVNIDKNPTAVQKFRTTSATKIKKNDVIVSCGESFRIISAPSFWSYDSDGGYWAFNGEYKIANVLLSLSAHDNPTAYFTVGHGEKVYDPENPESEESRECYELYRILLDNGLTVKTVNLDEEDIPSDCTLLIMNAPTEDYIADRNGALDRESYYYVNYTSPIEKIDRYMDEVGSVMIFTNPFTVLPTLEEYLLEWGMKVEHLQVKDRKSGESDADLISVHFPDSEEAPLGSSLYSEIINLSSPPRVVVKDSGYISEAWEDNEVMYSSHLSAMYSPVFLSSEDARAYNQDGLVSDISGGYHLGAITARVRTEEVSRYYSYMFVGASSSLCSSEQLQNGTYANYDLLFSTVRTLSRTDVYASDSLGALSMNTANYGGKILVSDAMSLTEREVYENQKVVKTYSAMSQSRATVFTLLCLVLPILILPLACIYIYTKRKYR